MIGVSSVQYVKVLSELLTKNGFHPGKALYVSVPILFSLTSFTFIAVGIFITAGVLNLIVIILGGNTSFEKSLFVYMRINIISSLHVLFAVITNFTTGSYKMPDPVYRYVLYIIIFLAMFYAFYKDFSMKKTKAFLGSLILIMIFISQEYILTLIS